MISAKQIREGIDNGVVRFIVDPNMQSGTVCTIGDSWFYFGGETAEAETPKDYLEHVPVEDIVGEIMDVLNDFYAHSDTFGDEYRYYEAILREQSAKPANDFKCGISKSIRRNQYPNGCHSSKMESIPMPQM